MNESELRPIRRLLVANRGEIARRVFRAARAMGISTVAVYADGDAEAPFVTDADLSVPLGGRTAAETYLSTGKVIAAAEASGADAVHPGYGFLSENADFARAVIDAGLVWVGPPPEAIAAMGDKLAAKETMTAAGVPTLPSIPVTDAMDDDGLQAAAAEIGYPVLVKASAGGGGKGMRIVSQPDDLADAVAAARREAAGAFGDDTVFLERYLAAPRHVEIQVLGDTQGNIIHCFERECSIQRRHQKVIEEAPSPAVTPALRGRMGAAAVAAVSTIGYCSAGTVEFLLEGSGDDAEFWFLEVNTRLQVEHPVTEEITGLDLVREQIRIAAGEPLGYGQDDIGICGHAIEARLYAEDPASGFLPQTGTVDLWRPATGFRALADSVAQTARTCADDTSDGLPATAGPNSASSWARFDSGIEAGSVVGTEFDPMLAKVIVAAPTRTEAALGLASALDRTRLGGVVTNRDFLCTVLRSHEFLAGDTTTDFIDRVYFGHNGANGEPSARTDAAGGSDESASAGSGVHGEASDSSEESAGAGAADQSSGGLAAQEPARHPMFIHTAAAAVALVSQECNRHAATRLDFMASGYRNSVMPDEVLPLSAALGSELVEASVQYRRQRDGRWKMRVGQLPQTGPYAGIGGDSGSGDSGSGAANDAADAGDGNGAPQFTDWSVRAHGITLRLLADARASASGAASAGFVDDAGDVDATVDVEVAVPGLAGFRGAWEVSRRGSRWYATGPVGGSVTLVQRSRFPDPDAENVEGGLVAPMPGKVLMVGVEAGDRVSAGQVLVVMEAMKMEHQITAPADGEVAEVRAVVGDQVDNGELLVVITADP